MSTRMAGVTLAVLLGGATAWAAENVASAVATPQTTMTPPSSPEAPAADGSAGAIESTESAAERGRAIFEKRCSSCHGLAGKGDGRVAKLFKPKPSDLTASRKTDEYKTSIITRGGAAMGRSVMMPSWEAEMSAGQISDVVAYLSVLAGNGG